MTRFRTILAALLFVAAALAAAVPAEAGQQDFTLRNTSDIAILSVHVSQSWKNTWEQDVLGNDVLLPGDSTRITFGGYNARDCYWDIKVTYIDGTVDYHNRTNLCRAHATESF